jgi:inosine/xanthosine triphosphatase
MKHIVIASRNPVKVKAVVNGFQRMFPEEKFEIRQEEVPSGVSVQPMTDEETLSGAINRAKNAALRCPEGDYWVGIEGGITDDGKEMTAYAWIVVLTSGLTGRSRTGTFILPPAVATWIRQGLELGEADDLVFGLSNSKQENGAIGILTGNVIDRAALYEHAVILALAPFKNESLYQ